MSGALALQKGNMEVRRAVSGDILVWVRYGYVCIVCIEFQRFRLYRVDLFGVEGGVSLGRLIRCPGKA